MAKVRSWAGLDVHAATVVAVTVDGESGELGTHRLPGVAGEVVAFCGGLPGPTRVAYEACPTGFGLARALAAGGIGCWSRHRGRSSGRRRIWSRPIAATRNGWFG